MLGKVFQFQLKKENQELKAKGSNNKEAKKKEKKEKEEAKKVVVK